MTKQKRSMPSEIAIRKFWAKQLWKEKGFDSESDFLKPGICFACGFEGKERCHIFPRCKGGLDSVENLHILCGFCHKTSECLEGENYYSWLLERNGLDRIVQGALLAGFNASNLLQNIEIEKIPYGSDLSNDGTTLVENASEQETIAIVHELRHRGFSYRDIAKELECRS